MRITRERIKRIARLARVFSWADLVWMKAGSILERWQNLPVMRRTRALRAFSSAVPLEEITLEAGEYHFRHGVGGREYAFSLRTRTSDVDVFVQVVLEEEYRDVLGMLPGRDGPLKILDAGANIGLTTLFFKAHCPDSEILSLEPEPGNFLQLQLCVEENGLKGVTALREGIWTRDTQLVPDSGFRDGRSWSFCLRESDHEGPTGFSALSLGTLLTRAGWDKVDLLKLDVEGAEGRLIRDPEFMALVQQRVKLVCMEVHEEVIRRREVQEAFEAMGMRSANSGETLLVWRSGETE